MTVIWKPFGNLQLRHLLLPSIMWQLVCTSDVVEAAKIVEYHKATQGKDYVVLSLQGKKVAAGTKLKVLRKKSNMAEERSIQTGTIKVVSATPPTAVAEVVKDSTHWSKVFFPQHPGVMVGDHAVLAKLSIEPKRLALPVMTFPYRSLFRDPKADPYTFELSAEGKAALRTTMEVFGSKKIEKLFIEGHTDQSGPFDRNQIESIQRANSVRQFLTRDLGFDPLRVTSLGFGETDLVDETWTDGFQTRNRRIVIRATRVGD